MVYIVGTAVGFLTWIGRLKPGVTLAQANMDVRALKISLGDGRHFNFNLMPVNDYIVGEARPALLALLIAVTCRTTHSCGAEQK